MTPILLPPGSPPDLLQPIAFPDRDGCRACTLTSISERSCWVTRSKYRFPMSGNGRGPGGHWGVSDGALGHPHSSLHSPHSPRSSRSPRKSGAMSAQAEAPLPNQRPRGLWQRVCRTPPSLPPRECGMSSLQGAAGRLKATGVCGMQMWGPRALVSPSGAPAPLPGASLGVPPV